MYVVLTLILLVQVVPDERQLNTTLALHRTYFHRRHDFRERAHFDNRERDAY